MDEDTERELYRQNALKAQAVRSQHGKIIYEEGGLGTLGEAEGEIVPGTDGYLLFNDPALLVGEQHSIFIPMHRVIRAEYSPTL